MKIVKDDVCVKDILIDYGKSLILMFVLYLSFALSYMIIAGFKINASVVVVLMFALFYVLMFMSIKYFYMTIIDVIWFALKKNKDYEKKGVY